MQLFNNSIIKSKKILITGGGGFIGSFLAKTLCQYQNRIVLLDACDPANSSAQEMGLLDQDNIEFIQANILNQLDVLKLPKDFDYIIHAAGILGIKKVCEYPLLTADVNVFGTRNVLELARQQKDLKRFILFSTSEVYGPHAEDVREEAPSVIPNVGMRWVYASSKQFSEYLLKAFIKEYAIPGVIIRPFNVYGPFRKGSNAFTTFVTRALANEEIIITGDGKQSRCWCYIDDFVQGIIQSLIKENIIGEAFNLGNSNESLSMFDLAQKICKLTNSQSTIRILGNKEEDVQDRQPNISKAKQLLDYQPQIDIETGITKVAEWLASSISLTL